MCVTGGHCELVTVLAMLCVRPGGHCELVTVLAVCVTGGHCELVTVLAVCVSDLEDTVS